MNRKIKITILVLVIVIVAAAAFYLTDYYHADATAESYLNGTDDVNVVKSSTGLLLDGPGNDSAIIFYPGAKIEYTSYLPLLIEIAHDGMDCYLVEMPFNLAFFGQDKANEIIEDSNYSHYFLAGHSLGGAMAASYINATNNTDGLILLGSYSTSEIEKPVLSIYGSEDKVLNMESYNESKNLYSDYFHEYIISGANHAQFANFGQMPNDGEAKITSQNQQNQTIDEIELFIENVLNE